MGSIAQLGSSLDLHEPHADRVGHLDARLGRLQLAGALIDAEHDHVPAGLIRHEHELPRRLDGEVAGGLDPLALMADSFELARLGVDGENRDRVVRVAVGDVDELPGRMDDRLRRTATLAANVFGECGQDLLLRQRAFVRIIIAGDDRQVGPVACDPRRC